MPFSREMRACFHIEDAVKELKRAREYLDGRNTKHLREEVTKCETELARIKAVVELEADHFEACGDWM